jgi:hypothetical protein
MLCPKIPQPASLGDFGLHHVQSVRAQCTDLAPAGPMYRPRAREIEA